MFFTSSGAEIHTVVWNKRFIFSRDVPVFCHASGFHSLSYCNPAALTFFQLIFFFCFTHKCLELQPIRNPQFGARGLHSRDLHTYGLRWRQEGAACGHQKSHSSAGLVGVDASLLCLQFSIWLAGSLSLSLALSIFLSLSRSLYAGYWLWKDDKLLWWLSAVCEWSRLDLTFPHCSVAVYLLVSLSAIQTSR